MRFDNKPTLRHGFLVCLAALSVNLFVAEVTLAAHNNLPPVAWVNKQPISRAMLAELLNVRMAGQSTSEQPQAPTPADRERALNDLIRVELMSQQAVALGLTSKPAAQADLDYQRKSTLGQRLLRNFSESVQVSDAEIQARYDTIEPDHELQASQVLLSNEAAAQKAIAQLNAGKPFAAVARAMSIDEASRKKGGRLDTALGAAFLQPFSVAAKGLSAGQYTRSPVQTELGWHVILLHKKTAVAKASIADMRETLLSQLTGERVEAQIERWHAEAQVKILPPLDDQSLAKPKSPVASIRGQEISRWALAQLISARTGSANPYEPADPKAPVAAPISAQDRETILRELIQVEVLAQQATAQGLDKNSAVEAELALQQKTLSSRMYVNHFMATAKVEPAELQALYETDVPALAFKVSQIVVPTQADAQEVIEALNKGGNFAQLAREHSTEVISKKKGGHMGWLRNEAMLPTFAVATRLLKVGHHTQQPVLTENGWHVITLHATRPAPRPSLETAKALLYPKLMQQKMQAEIERLRTAATISRIP